MLCGICLNNFLYIVNKNAFDYTTPNALRHNNWLRD